MRAFKFVAPRLTIMGSFFGVDKKTNEVSKVYTISRDGAIFTFGYSSEDYEADKMEEDSSEPEPPGTPEQRQNAEESKDVNLKKRKDLDAHDVEPDEDDWLSLHKKRRTLLRKDFFMQAPAKLTASDYHKGLDMVVVGFFNGVFALYQMPDFVCLHLLSISREKITTAVFNGLGNWSTFGCAKLGQLLEWEWKLESYALKQRGHYFDVIIRFSAVGYRSR